MKKQKNLPPWAIIAIIVGSAALVVGGVILAFNKIAKIEETVSID